jgi:hypothetical protein
MHWTKLGNIFDPTAHGMLFAQSPQTLVCDEHVRVYFSTRVVDPVNGKYLSHIAYADYSRDMHTLLRVSNHTVIPLGELGCFDEHGIFPINLLRHEGRVMAYTCGWNRRVSVSVDTAIGLAYSDDDGHTFQRHGHGPVLAQSLHEPCLVGDGFVKVIDGVFHMWYIFGTGWKRKATDGTPERTYKIGHAVSEDGIKWTKEEARQIVADRLGPDESQALPTVITVKGRHHMFFCYRESVDFRSNAARGYRIGHAWSDDLKDWTRDDDQFALQGTPGAWDAHMQCYPHVFECDGKVYLLYNGNEFGRQGFGLAVLAP